MQPTAGRADQSGSGSCDTDDSGFVAAAEVVPESVRRLLRGVHSDRVLGLLFTIDSQDGVPVRDLLRDDLCESDLHGSCAELRAAGLLEPCEVAGERGYRTTETAHDALERLRTA